MKQLILLFRRLIQWALSYREHGREKQRAYAQIRNDYAQNMGIREEIDQRLYDLFKDQDRLTVQTEGFIACIDAEKKELVAYLKESDDRVQVFALYRGRERWFGTKAQIYELRNHLRRLTILDDLARI